MESAESDAAGGEAGAGSDLGSRQPVTPPKPCPPKQPAVAAGPVQLTAEKQEETEPEKNYGLADLQAVVTTLGALDACLQHFSSKASTPESTLEPGAQHDAVVEAPMGEDLPDWGDAEGQEEGAPDWDELGQLMGKMTGSSPEEIKRLGELLEAHKNSIEKVLEQQDAKQKEANAAGDVFQAMMNQDWQKASELLEPLRPEQVEQMQDYGGLTVLHHAVRSGSCDLVLAILTKSPSLANRVTLPHRQPGNWTPLMILANVPGDTDADAKIGYLLCQHMDLAALNVRGTSWSTATHMAVSRSKWSLTKSILYRIDDLGGRGAVMDHTKQANNAESSLNMP